MFDRVFTERSDMPADDKAKEPLIGTDLVLLLLGADTSVPSARDQIHGITRLEKLLYLADRETKVSGNVDGSFKFKAYNYGPYSKEIYEAVDVLEEAGLLRETRVFEGRSLDELEELDTSGEGREGVERRFELTVRGKAVAKMLSGQHPDVLKSLSQIKNKYAGMPLQALIRYVYSVYPEDATQSIIRDEVLRG